MALAILAGVKIDLHLHTNHSFDGWASPDVVVRMAIARGLDRIAITDHETIDGALVAHRAILRSRGVRSSNRRGAVPRGTAPRADAPGAS